MAIVFVAVGIMNLILRRFGRSNDTKLIV